MSGEGTPPEPKAEEGASKTFTQEDVNRLIATEKRRIEARFADYDEVKGKADKFDQLDASTKSDVEKANEKAAAAEKRAADAESKALRLEVATAKGLTPAQAKRLTGTTKDELEADAEELLETFKPAPSTTGDGEGGGDPTPKPGGGKPTEDLRGGGDPTSEPAPDIRKVIEDIPRGI